MTDSVNNKNDRSIDKLSTPSTMPNLGVFEDWGSQFFNVTIDIFVLVLMRFLTNSNFNLLVVFSLSPVALKTERRELFHYLLMAIAWILQ